MSVFQFDMKLSAQLGNLCVRSKTYFGSRRIGVVSFTRQSRIMLTIIPDAFIFGGPPCRHFPSRILSLSE